MPTKRTKMNTSIPEIVAELHDIREKSESLAEQTKRLEESLRLARGTGDHTAKAIAARGAKGSFNIGDNTDTPTLIATVERAITGYARTLRELVELTGARRNRISGALVKIQVAHPTSVQNVGNDARALWYIAPKRPNGVYSSRRRRSTRSV